MGNIIKLDRALAMDILLEVMSKLEDEWCESAEDEKSEILLEGALYLIAFCFALQGEEGAYVYFNRYGQALGCQGSECCSSCCLTGSFQRRN